MAKRRTTLSKRGRSDEDTPAPQKQQQQLQQPASEVVETRETVSPPPIFTPRISSEVVTSQIENKQEKAGILNKQIESDINDFQELKALQEARSKSDKPANEGGVFKVLKDVFSAVLIADFFVVLVFLAWFLAAAAMQSTNPFLLERFQDIFQVLQLPLRIPNICRRKSPSNMSILCRGCLLYICLERCTSCASISYSCSHVAAAALYALGKLAYSNYD
jgi:hypothetical protein